MVPEISFRAGAVPAASSAVVAHFKERSKMEVDTDAVASQVDSWMDCNRWCTPDFQEGALVPARPALLTSIYPVVTLRPGPCAMQRLPLICMRS